MAVRTHKSPHHEFGEWLTLTLANRGMASRQLAEELGVADAAVSRWRTGASRPQMNSLTEIARVLNLDPLRLAVTAGVIPGSLAQAKPYPMPQPEAQRESVRRQIARIRGLSEAERDGLLAAYEDLIEQGKA